MNFRDMPFELMWKYLREWFNMVAAPREVQTMNFRDMPFELMREYLMEWSNMTAAGNLSLFF